MNNKKISDKIRLDTLLVDRGLASSRQRARAVIMSGVVFVDGERNDKPGTVFCKDADIIIKGNPLKYVSRGGLKLEKAIESFSIELEGRVCMDIGASTGGFTDCMLQNNAAKVYAVDVGYGQLDWKLRTDPRVVCMERTNIRYIEKKLIQEPVNFASVDVSFISLSKVFPAVVPLLSKDAKMAVLIKPQFEAGREKVGKKGVVRDKATHIEVIENVIGYAYENGLGFDLDFKKSEPQNNNFITYSPVKGPQGNIEYLLYLKKITDVDACDAEIDDVGTDTEELSSEKLKAYSSILCVDGSYKKEKNIEEIIKNIVDEAHLNLMS